MKTYQITLGKLRWDTIREEFRSIKGWDMEGAQIPWGKVAENEKMARDKSSNVYGWKMNVIEEVRWNL